jgi:NAD+ synthase (glutamine-hydrolysing)
MNLVVIRTDSFMKKIGEEKMEKVNLNEFGYFRAGAAVIDMKVGDVAFNSSQHIKILTEAAKTNVELMVFPELSLIGYTAADMLFQQQLLEDCLHEIQIIATECANLGMNAIVGLPVVQNGRLFNAAAFLSDGQILGIVPKSYLCNADEYYEERWFSCEADKSQSHINIAGKEIPFGADLIFEAVDNQKIKIGIEICEDLWTIKPPSQDLAAAGCSIICNLSASNEYIGKTDSRISIVEMQSKRLLSAYVYSSSGPAESTTDTVFSGHSMIYETGEQLCETEKYEFDSHFCYADIDVDYIDNVRRLNNSYSGSKTGIEYRLQKFNRKNETLDKIDRHYKKCPYLASESEFMQSIELNEMLQIQKTALSSRLRAIGCKNVVIGLSGGLDSTLALLVILQSYEQLGLPVSGIHVLTMPGFGTTGRTKSNAEKLCEALDISCKVISIEDAVRLHFTDIGHDEDVKNITYENAQARERTQILMDYANKVGGIVVGTGDMSEIALGWSTYNADHMSMYNPNCGVPKTLVQSLVRYFADEIYYDSVSDILHDICDTPISPELLPPDESGEIEQKTEDNIGPYELHDFFLYHHLKSNFKPKKVAFITQLAFGDKYSAEVIEKWLKVFYKRFVSQQFKRSAIPDGPKICSISLSPRAQLRMPSDGSSAGFLSAFG